MTNANLRLVPIDRATWRRAYSLRPRPDQERFVAPNAYSMIEARYATELVPLLATAGDEAVGFAMYGVDPDDGRLWIVRLMIGADHQGRGHGARLLDALLERLEREFPARPIRLGYVPGNEVAEALYRRRGFVDTGEVEDGERIMERPAPSGEGPS